MIYNYNNKCLLNLEINSLPVGLTVEPPYFSIWLPRQAILFRGKLAAFKHGEITATTLTVC
jgi:hypothetical protein